MTIKVSDELINKACELYINGMSTQRISDSLNLSITVTRRIIKEKNIKFRKPKSCPQNVIDEYISGKSTLFLSKKYNISRGCIVNALRKRNIIIRNGSEANIIRFKDFSLEERKNITIKANNSLRGIKYTEEQLEKRNTIKNGKGVVIGRGEKELISLCSNIFNSVKGQFTIGKYNVDFLLNDHFAVEVKVGFPTTNKMNSPPSKSMNFNRIKYIRDRGYSIIDIRIAFNSFTINNLNKIVSDLQIICQNPSSISQYWMIKCGFKDVTTFRGQSNGFSSIDPSHRTIYFVRKLD